MRERSLFSLSFAANPLVSPFFLLAVVLVGWNPARSVNTKGGAVIHFCVVERYDSRIFWYAARIETACFVRSACVTRLKCLVGAVAST